MDLEDIMISQTEKEKYCMISLIVESEKNSHQTHRKKEHICGYQSQGAGEGVGNWRKVVKCINCQL